MANKSQPVLFSTDTNEFWDYDATKQVVLDILFGVGKFRYDEIHRVLFNIIIHKLTQTNKESIFDEINKLYKSFILNVGIEIEMCSTKGDIELKYFSKATDSTIECKKNSAEAIEYILDGFITDNNISNDDFLNDLNLIQGSMASTDDDTGCQDFSCGLHYHISSDQILYTYSGLLFLINLIWFEPCVCLPVRVWSDEWVRQTCRGLFVEYVQFLVALSVPLSSLCRVLFLKSGDFAYLSHPVPFAKNKCFWQPVLLAQQG